MRCGLRQACAAVPEFHHEVIPCILWYGLRQGSVPGSTLMIVIEFGLRTQSRMSSEHAVTSQPKTLDTPAYEVASLSEFQY